VRPARISARSLASRRFWGNGVDRSPKGDGMARIVYIFYLSKFVEFGDTVIMVGGGNARLDARDSRRVAHVARTAQALKKNYHQITWLHVYHHWSISIIWHIIARVAPGGDAYFSTALNSFIHVIMYAYYCWSALYSKKDKSGAPAKPNWTEPAFYKKYITSMQMLQFVSMMAQALYDIVVPNPYPRFLAWTLFIYMITMLALFGNFFTKSYSKSKAGKDE
jgi:elongation of very long chain fatty acids protein 4